MVTETPACAPLLWPPRQLRRTLRAITERMARDLAGPATAAPDFTPTEWRLARAVAVMHGVSALLPGRVDWHGPSAWTAFLEAQREHIRDRQLRSARLLDEINRRTRVAGIAFVALKGAALHALGLYAPGERPMADLDLWVGEHDRRAMAWLLGALGYQALLTSATEDVYLPPGIRAAGFGEHADSGITIEVHARLSQPMPLTVVDLSDRIFPERPLPGRNDYRSAGALMGHLLMHAAVNMQLRQLRLVQLHDVALLAPRLGAAGWSDATHFGAESQPSWWALPPLRLVNRYYRDAIPAEVIEVLEPSCNRRLRRLARRSLLTDVSGSNPHSVVFPGLSWAQSAREALRFVAARLGRGARVASGRIGVIPPLALYPWAKVSHRRRLLDVLFRRYRADTLFTVNAALRGDP
jgi:putative nucleotidyltransferase-like protein